MSSRCLLVAALFRALQGPGYFLEVGGVTANTPLPREATICIAEIQAAPRLLLLPLVFPSKSWLGREPEQAGHCNLVMEGTGACSLFTQAVQPAAKHKKRQQTLPGKLTSRAEELFYCSVNGAGRFLCSHIQYVSDEFLLLSTLLANNCRVMPWSLVHTVSLLLSNVTRLPKQ